MLADEEDHFLEEEFSVSEDDSEGSGSSMMMNKLIAKKISTVFSDYSADEDQNSNENYQSRMNLDAHKSTKQSASRMDNDMSTNCSTQGKKNSKLPEPTIHYNVPAPQMRPRISHFDMDLTDEEFLNIVVSELKKLNMENVTYKVFRKHFLPKHRKPTFSDYARFRKLEKVLLKTQ